MSYPAHYSRFNKVSLWLLSRSTWQQVLIGGATCLLFSSVLVFVVLLFFVSPNATSLTITVFIIASVVVPSLVSGLLLPAVLKLGNDRLTKVLGFLPSPKEQVDLNIWFTRGVIPESERLRVALPRYLESVRSIVVVGRLYKYRWVNNLIFASFLLYIISTLIRFITATSSLFDYFAFVIYIVLALTTIPFPFKKGSPFTRIFMARSFKNYQIRRKELSKR